MPFSSSSSSPSSVDSTAVVSGTKRKFVSPDIRHADDEDHGRNWRGDPAETFSDWTVEISVMSRRDDEDDDAQATATTTYRVHKYVVACGERKSVYFANLFRRNGFKECASCKSTIQLEPLSVRAFPQLLDYMYAADRPLQIDTASATALVQLGEYFEVPALTLEAKAFCKQDITLDTVYVYQVHTSLFQNESIQCLLAEFLGKNILNISPSSSIVTDASPELWIKTLEVYKNIKGRAVNQLLRDDDSGSDDDDTTGGSDDDDDATTSRSGSAGYEIDVTVGSALESRHISKLVAGLAKSQAEALDAESFEKLTERVIMPWVHPDVALVLCDLDDTFCGSSELSCLQKGCARALAQNWDELEDCEGEGNVPELLMERKKSFLVHLLGCTVESAKRHLGDVQDDLEASNAKVASLENRVDHLKNKHKSWDKKATTLQNEVSHLCKALKATTNELHLAKNRLQSFQPVPIGGWLGQVPGGDDVRYVGHGGHHQLFFSIA